MHCLEPSSARIAHACGSVAEFVSARNRQTTDVCGGGNFFLWHTRRVQFQLGWQRRHDIANHTTDY